MKLESNATSKVFINNSPRSGSRGASLLLLRQAVTPSHSVEGKAGGERRGFLLSGELFMYGSIGSL